MLRLAHKLAADLVLGRSVPLALEQLHRDHGLPAETNDLISRVVEVRRIVSMHVQASRALTAEIRPASISGHVKLREPGTRREAANVLA